MSHQGIRNSCSQLFLKTWFTESNLISSHLSVSLPISLSKIKSCYVVAKLLKLLSAYPPQPSECWDYRCVLLFIYFSILSVQKDPKSTATVQLLIQNLNYFYKHILLRRKFIYQHFVSRTVISSVAESGG